MEERGRGIKGRGREWEGRDMGSKSPSLKYFLCLLPCQQPTYIGTYTTGCFAKCFKYTHMYIRTLYLCIHMYYNIYVCMYAYKLGCSVV